VLETAVTRSRCSTVVPELEEPDPAIFLNKALANIRRPIGRSIID
jgi:hypothetical protein